MVPGAFPPTTAPRSGRCQMAAAVLCPHCHHHRPRRNKQSQLSAPVPAPGQVIEAPGPDLPPALQKAALANQTTAPPPAP